MSLIKALQIAIYRGGILCCLLGLVLPIGFAQDFEDLNGASGFIHHIDSNFAHVELLLGFGAKQQYQSATDIFRDADSIIEQNDKKFGPGKWAILYGGDGSNSEKPDVGLLAKYFSDHKVPVFAAQQRIVKEQWGGVPKWVSGVFYSGPIGQQSADVKWGGIERNVDASGKSVVTPIGNTAVYLGYAMRNTLGSKLVVRAVGGGDIAFAEAQYAIENKVPVFYHRHSARYEKDGKTTLSETNATRFGPLNEFDWNPSFTGHTVGSICNKFANP